MRHLVRIFAASVALTLFSGCVPYPTIRWLASPMVGEVKTEGRPVADLKVIRHYHSAWYDQQVDQTTRTDSEGKFKLPSAWKPSLIFFIHQPVISIDVFAERNGRRIPLLHQTKMNYDRLGEMDPYSGEAEGIGKLSRQGNHLFLEVNLPSKD